MTRPCYQSLSREQIALLLAAENAHLERAWDSLSGALHGVVGMLSVTYPRPLYYFEDSARQRLTQEPEHLRGTPLHAAAVRNVHAAQEIERLFGDHGHTPELHAMVDAYLDALLDEFDAIRFYPERPPARPEENGLAGHRAVAGR